MINPSYQIPAGLLVIGKGKSRRMFPNGDGFFRVEDGGTGEVQIMSYNQSISFLKQPGISNGNMLIATNIASARIRSGGLHYQGQLSESGRDQLEFRKALCAGVDVLMDRGVRITNANLNKPENSKLIREIAGKLYVTRPISLASRGGSPKLIAVMPKGRTLKEYWCRYRESGYDEMALVDQTWLRGNRSARISTQVRELMTLAIEEIYLDKKKPTVAATLRRLSDRIKAKNVERGLANLEPLPIISHKTLGKQIENCGSTVLAIAREGAKAAENNRMRGSTDTRALMIGELVEVDECKLSIITVAKVKGWWLRLTEEDQKALEEIEEIVRTRLFLVLMIDVATRMPLAWVLTNAPSGEATLEALRMATRDKTREKILYGCECDPMPAVGIGSLKGDNGAGIRNAAVKSGALGLSAQTVDVRTYRGGDKPHVERMFGTLESSLLSLIHGYTGRKAGALPGYDAIKNGVLDCEALYGIITRYLVDEYPLERHYGTTMMGQRPIKVAEKVNEDYGVISVPGDHDRRIQLGWKSECKITDEGVRVFGLPYTSPELQCVRDRVTKKVAVYIDPDCVNHVSILLEGDPEPILGYLSWTAMQDLTLPEFLRIAADARAEDLEESQEFESIAARVRQDRFTQMHFVANEHKLARSYMTITEARAKAQVIMAGVHVPVWVPTSGTAQPGSVGDETGGEGIHKVGAGFQPALDGRQQPVSSELNVPNTLGKLK